MHSEPSVIGHPIPSPKNQGISEGPGIWDPDHSPARYMSAEIPGSREGGKVFRQLSGHNRSAFSPFQTYATPVPVTRHGKPRMLT
tara:strand:+ start:467 stop:721 length:255 start_codon:yes stop_codon:yes gene_type:complete